MCATPRAAPSGLAALARGGALVLALLAMDRVALAGPEAGEAGAKTAGPPRITVDVRGPVALIELDRPVQLGREYGQRDSDEAVLDLALPPGSRLVDAEVRGAAAFPLRFGPQETAAATYADFVRIAELERAKAAVDEGADLRLQVAGAGFGAGDRAAQLRLRARFVAPLACAAGDLVLAFPAALDADPRAALVTVTTTLGAGAPPLERIDVGDTAFPPGRGRLQAQVPTRAPWQITLTPRRAASARDAGFLLAAVAPAPGAPSTAVAGLCRGPVTQPGAATKKGRDAEAPERVLFLLDRSRSMGGAGVGGAAALARALALALPPGARFAAVLFDREAAAHAPVFRATTLENLAALESAASGGLLRNGTRLLPALRLGQKLLERDEAGANARTLVVVITDGALPEDHGPAAFAEALRAPVFARAQWATLILRAPHEERPAGFALRTFARLAEHRGGVVRELPPAGAAEAVGDIIASLARGGDLVGVRVTAGLQPAPGEPPAVAPGQGAVFVGRATGGPVRVAGSLGGARTTVTAAAVSVASPWGRGLSALTKAGPVAPPQLALPAATGAPPVIALLAAPLPPLDERLTRGGLDKDVVHRALTYAYLPRARACYVTRAIKTAADFQLRGRLRLELRIERGEMMEAAVIRSSLGRPDIESCLREAAYSVEIPRPVLNDAPALAALNLVFRPRTDTSANPAPSTGDRAFDHAVDRAIAPAIGELRRGGKPIDPLELLIEDEPHLPIENLGTSPGRANVSDAGPP